MTLLDVITAAAAAAADNDGDRLDQQPDYPTVLDAVTGLGSLHQSAEEPPNPALLVYPVFGFKLSTVDTRIAESSKKFFTEISRYLKNTKAFNRVGFEEKVRKFLIKVSHIYGCRDEFGPSDGCILIERFGFAMGRDVDGLVIDGCILLEIWNWLQTLILNKLVPQSSCSKLINHLVEKRKSDLICECVKNLTDLKAGDILSILRYFLVPSKDAYLTIGGIAKEWESQAVKAVERVSDDMLIKNNLALAKKSAILLMMAYDEFSASELCLHYLFAAVTVDELVWTSAISKLNGKEMMALIRYLGKWLKKYDRFPQAVSCPEASLVLGLKVINWLPKIDDVVNCLGLVIDEHFSTLVLHQEFHDEMRSLDGLVGSLVLDARLCCSLTYVVENLKSSESLRVNPSPEENVAEQ